mmetsp:Transcript_41065/g.57752  ORF Transcript_41065/g.57752 Transcript_41065/m.57752 type:complete len:499 (+) Transcript_41065:52-1548(+)
MSDDDDLFGSSDSDGGDTDDLIKQSKSKPVAKKKRLQKKKPPAAKKRKLPDADNDNDSDGDLFADSDDEQETKKKQKKPAKPMSKREKLEALQAKKRQDNPSFKESSGKRSKNDLSEVDKLPDGQRKEKGYESGDSYDSANYVRTKDDDDFIDRDGDDEDAINELYAEQRFDDERPLDSDEEQQRRKKKGASSSYRKKGPDSLSDIEGEPDNPILAAVQKMKKKKKEARKLTELEDDARSFIARMESAADDDLQAVKARRPATKKLSMLGQVTDMFTRRDMTRHLLDLDVLAVAKRWIQPLPNGSLGNVTVRQSLIRSIANMGGENGITSGDLKRSGIGQTIMVLYKHKSETPAMKRELKNLIEQWSRPIFQKSGNMKDLEHAHATRTHATNRPAQRVATATPRKTRKDQDIQSLIASGAKGSQKDGISRVRVPFSKGFQFTVRPQNKTGNVADKRMVRGGAAKDNRGNLSKRMLEKGRVSQKNGRSAHLSIEGRSTK